MATLDRLRAVATAAAHDLELRAEERMAAAAGTAEGLLFRAIDGQDDRQLRRTLLRLKRDTHNRRPPRQTDLTMVREAEVSASLLEALGSYARSHTELEEARRRARSSFEEERLAIRRLFRESIRDDDFRKALLLSSRTLFESLPRYERSPVARPTAKARQIERSLMRYLSRMVMKATPFSTFCTLLPGQLGGRDSDTDAAAAARPVFEGAPGTKRARLRLDKGLYASLLPFVKGEPALRRYLPIEINPTLSEQPAGGDGDGGSGERWLFLTSRGSQEVFQRLPPNPIVGLLRGHLGAEGPTPFGELVELLADKADAEAAEASAYLDRLIEIGLLRFRLGISEQEVDWDSKLGALLDPIDHPLAERIRRFLSELRQAVDAYGRASVDQRPALLGRATQAVRELFGELSPKGQIGPRAPFYEDAGGEARVELELGPIEQCLTEYVELTSRLVHPQTDQANMRHFFDHYYGRDAPPISLLRFYEDFYREHFKEHLERRRQRDVAKGDVAKGDAAPAAEPEDGDEVGAAAHEPYDFANPFGLPFLRAIEHGFGELKRRVGELWRQDPEARELILERADLEAAVGHLPPLEVPCKSVSLFTQYLHGAAEDGGPALVARGYLAGYGKYFSRFLYLLPEAVLRDLQESNRHLSSQELAEICGDSNFNANLHPPLLPTELGYPTGESSDSAQIPAADLLVGRDPKSPHRLRLIRESNGKTVVPVDLGFLNPRMRPPLFQLLSRFTPVASFGLPLPDSPHVGTDGQQNPADPESEENGPTTPAVLYRPRITYRGRLVLARRQWSLELEHFPAPEPGEGDADYFCRLRQWRLELGLPAEVFLRIDVKRMQRPGSARQHLYKPQYLDFDDPLLVDLLARTCESLAAARLSFEERLPGHAHLVASDDGERWATEMIFQLDFPEAPPEQETPRKAPEAEGTEAEGTEAEGTEAEGTEAATANTIREVSIHG